MNLSDRHRHLLHFEQGLFAGLINIVINGAIAWLILRSYAEIPLWGETSMGVDLLATGFLLPFFTCMIVSRLIRSQVRKGKLPALETHHIGARGLHHHSILKRSLVLGVTGVLFAAAPMVAILDLAQAAPVAVLSFVSFKAIWAGLFAMVVSPIIAWWALSDASHELAIA